MTESAPVAKAKSAAAPRSMSEQILHWLGFSGSQEKKSWESVAQRRQYARRAPSFTDLLPYVKYDAEEEVFVLKDGSMGAMFELGALPTEAQPLSYLAERAAKVQEALQAIVEAQASPWVVQFFVSDDRNIDALNATLREYILQVHRRDKARAREVLSSRLTSAVLVEVEKHLQQVSRPQGLFFDNAVSKQIWRGQLRRIRCCIYKRFDGSSAEDPSAAIEQIEAVATTLRATFLEAGVTVRRCSGQDLYEWLLPFFNRKPLWAKETADLLRLAPYPGGALAADEARQGPKTGADAVEGAGAGEGGSGAHGANSSNGASGASGSSGANGKSAASDAKDNKDCGAAFFGWDFAEQLNFSEPRSDVGRGTIEFDGVPVRALVLQNLWHEPQIGHFTAELPSGKESFARFDRMPPGTMLSITVTIEPQHMVQRRIERIRDSSRAKNALAAETHRECEMVLERMVGSHDKLFPMFMTLYLSAATHEQLQGHIAEANSLLIPSGLRFIEPQQDLVAIDAFLRALPFNFDPAFDEKHMKRSRLTFASQIARLLPVYGRSRGSAHPNMWFWNRGGEPLWLDPLNKSDRQKNAHMLVLGPTGAGKSATLNYLAMMSMAVHRPRLVIVDAGNSFGLLVQFFKEMGLSTHNVTLNMGADVSLPPFVHACRLLDDKELMGSFQAIEQGIMPDEKNLPELLRQSSPETSSKVAAHPAAPAGAAPNQGNPGNPGNQANPGANSTNAANAANATNAAAADDSDESDKRDLLGEMLVAAILMITGGEQREQERLTRADRYLISRAIIEGARKARADGKTHPLVQDIALELMAMQQDASLSASRQSRAEDMGQSMMAFTQGLRGKLFNRAGVDWPDADVTLVEMGTLTNDGYGDALAVAYMSLMDSTQSRGERFQYEGRPIIFLTDEGHLITTNDLLGPKIAKATKMWRKLNVWLWLATQNLQDFPDSMERVLSMCEYWLLLTMDKSEIEQVTRFRSLSPEQRHMMESARKETPKYTEGVIINASGQFLFRNVPPALPIALAMTEGHEKAQRFDIMRERGCTELQAAMIVAQQLALSRA